MKRLMTAMIACLLLLRPATGQIDSLQKWGDWKTWGEQGNGTYKNPVLPSDYSDLDCIRVNNDYYAISSTFQFSPGMVVLHSIDLVNWEILSHVVTDLNAISPEMNWDKMNRYGRGIWAGSIRYYNKKFWVYFGTPDEGYFMSSAIKPEGPWEPLYPVLAEKGWDDCCPFWDDDGQAYFIGTSFSNGYQIHLWKMTADGKDLLPASDKVIYQSKGSEANKLYKINGLYYHFFSEVKKDGRAVMMERSNNIGGPYEGPKQLSYSQKNYYEPNQGGIVQTPQGQWYFLTHHGTGDWSGRIASLLPVTWIDGWPIIGQADSNKIGSMVWQGKMPAVGKQKLKVQTDDDFNTTTLLPQWEWNYQPRADKWSLTERKGWLRLHAFIPIQENNLLKAGNTLTQRVFRTTKNEAIVKFNISGIIDGQHTGLAHFSSPDYAIIGVVCKGTSKTLEFAVKGASLASISFTENIFWLKSSWGLDGQSQFAYSIDGIHYKAFGTPYQLMWGAYRGDRIAIYNYNNKADAGYVDVDFFHYQYVR